MTPCKIRACGLCIDNTCTEKDDNITPNSFACQQMIYMPDARAILQLRAGALNQGELR